MAKFISLALTVALAVVVVAEPLRYRRQSDLIASAGAVAADGSGWAADNHAEAVIAVGIPGSGAGWGSDASPGVPASILISSQGLSEVGNSGSIAEITSNDGAGNLLGAQQIGVDQIALGENALAVEAAGGDVALASSSDAIAQGEGSSAAAGTLDILAAPGSGWSGSNLGMAKP